SKAIHFSNETLAGSFPIPWFSCLQIFVPDTKRCEHSYRIAGEIFFCKKITGSLFQSGLLPTVRVKGFSQRCQTKAVPFPIRVMLKSRQHSSQRACDITQHFCIFISL